MANPVNEISEAKSSRPLRILMLHNHYQIRGGEGSSFMAEMSLLREAGHTVDAYERDNVDVEKQGKLKTACGTFWSRESREDIEVILKGAKYDVMHVQNFFPLISPSVYGAARAAGVAVVQSLRNYRLLCANALLARGGQPCELCLGKRVGWQGVRHRCYRGSLAGSVVVAGMAAFHRWRGTWDKDVDCFIAPSEVTKRKYLEGGFREEQIRVKPNVVDFITDSMQDGQRQGAIYVGRLSEEKGVRTIVKSWVDNDITVPLLIVGDGPLDKELRDVAAGNSAISFAGWVEMAEAYRLISESELLLLPTECYESFGRTVLEAYAVETPVIATKGTAPGDLVRDGETGYHIEMGKPVDLARVVDRFFAQDYEGRREMGRAAKRYYEESFSRAANLQLMEEIYAEAIDRRLGGK